MLKVKDLLSLPEIIYLEVLLLLEFGIRICQAESREIQKRVRDIDGEIWYEENHHEYSEYGIQLEENYEYAQDKMPECQLHEYMASRTNTS